jgi:hypothetical protein
LISLASFALIIAASAPAVILRATHTVNVKSPQLAINTHTSIMLDGPTDPEEFEAFLDPLVAALMNANHIPGAAITVVKGGKIFFATGMPIWSGTPATPI